MSALLKIICGVFLVGAVKSSDDYKNFQRGFCQLKVEFNEFKENILGNEEFDIWKPLRKIWCDIKFEKEEYLQLAVTIFVLICIVIIVIMLLKAICHCLCGRETANGW